VATFYVVRHAKAGSRSHWTGDDRKRPLSKKGQQQAEALVEVFADLPVADIFSSPYLRCIQTVEPLALARGRKVHANIALSEGRGVSGLYDFFTDPNLGNAVLCTHGDVMWELVEDLTNRKVLPAFKDAFDKGSTWAVEVEDGSPVRARYIPAP
jgi:broad specificity phosphatase PhoE